MTNLLEQTLYFFAGTSDELRENVNPYAALLAYFTETVIFGNCLGYMICGKNPNPYLVPFAIDGAFRLVNSLSTVKEFLKPYNQREKKFCIPGTIGTIRGITGKLKK